MTSYSKDGTVGPWAKEKLACLGQYLQAYTSILNKQNFLKGYLYFDAFAGAGRAKLRTKSRKPIRGLFDEAVDGEQQEFVDGSPRVALAVDPPFTQYIFVDASAERVAELEKLKALHPELRIRIQRDDASAAIDSILINNRGIDWRRWRGVVLLDPFGLQVKWPTLEAIAKTKSLEVLINFPLGHTIHRLLSKAEMPNAARQQLLDGYFGSPEWRDVVYEKSLTLFDDVDFRKIDDAGTKLVKWYNARLKQIFGHSAAPRVIRNSHGTPIYYLLFAGPNATGAKIANHILRQGDPVR